MAAAKNMAPPLPAPPLAGMDVEGLDKELAERNLYQFMQQGWGVIEPGAFVLGWHIEVMCEHLEAISRGEIQNLVINVPPRHTKSVTVCVMWPAWDWLKKPFLRWMFSSYASGLSIRDSVKCRRLIQSDWYQRRWGDRYSLMGDQNAKERYDTSRGGYRLATSVGGANTGEGGDRLVVDDPHNIKTVESETIREGVLAWWDQVMSSRLNDPKKSSKIVIMQRSHDRDLTGHVRKLMGEGGEKYEFLILAAELEKKISVEFSSTRFKDPRTKPGTLLWENRFGRREVESLKTSLGSQASAAQLQQRPTPAEGGMIKRHWFRFYCTRNRAIPKVQVLPDRFDFMLQSWDMAFKDLKSSAYVVGEVWGVADANRYLLDEIREHLGFTATLKAVERLTEKWPEATAKYVEDKANGPAVLDQLRDKVPGLIAFTPEGSKESRAFSVTPEIEAGNVWLPHPDICPWINDYIEELAQFNRGAYDDRVDATSQALIVIRKKMRVLERASAPIVSMTRSTTWTSMSE